MTPISRGVASPDCPGGQSWRASRWRVSTNCALARTGGVSEGGCAPSEAGRFWNFDTEFTQFSDNFYVKFIPLEMFKYTPFSIFFLFSSLSSPFSSPPFLPFSPFFSSLFLSFPFSLFLPPFLFPFLFSFSLLPSLFSSFPSFFFPFPLFPLPDFCSPSRFLVSGGAVCPPRPPIGYAPAYLLDYNKSCHSRNSCHVVKKVKLEVSSITMIMPVYFITIYSASRRVNTLL